MIFLKFNYFSKTPLTDLRISIQITAITARPAATAHSDQPKLAGIEKISLRNGSVVKLYKARQKVTAIKTYLFVVKPSLKIIL